MTPPLSPDELPDIVVLLDDQLAPAHEARSRLYSGLRHCLRIEDPNTLAQALQTMQTGLRKGLFAVMLLDYELGEQLQGLPPRPSTTLCSQILLFGTCTHLTTTEVDDWLEKQSRAAQLSAQTATQTPIPTLTGWQPNVTPTDFKRAIDIIHERIERGDTYQVNLCFNIAAALNGDPIALYRELRKHQAVAYGALIGLPDDRWVLSRSPELFVSNQAGRLQARPMKGTAHAGGNLDLATDPKNQAENVMIVDLLRNDLGRISVAGSVSVPKRFEVQRYGEVLQMTSTVQAQLQPSVDWMDLLEGVFPCGSITGAPKHSTMHIIRELEHSPRGIYTGAIGWIDPGPVEGLNDFCFSVPIRTLTVSPPLSNGQRRVELGVGAGITYDSQAEDEWAECALKARFLNRFVTEASLFETMRAHRDTDIAHLERHLNRLSRSAATLGFCCDIAAVRQRLLTATACLPPDTEHRLRLDLYADGQTRVTSGVLTPIEAPVRVLLAPDHMHSGDFLLRHKTSARARYDAAWQHAVARGAFDMLFFNEHDELTEGGRSNVFVKLDGCWYTPPLEAGVLPGVMRAVLLEDAALDARIKSIARADLAHAQAVLVCNALRGALSAEIVAD